MAVTRSHLVGVIPATLTRFAGVAVTAGIPDAGGTMALPVMVMPTFDFSPSHLIALGLPLLILTVGIANVQSLAILRSARFQAPGNAYGLAAGAASLINALGGGHQRVFHRHLC